MEVEEKDDRETICAELFEDVTGSLDDLAKGDGRLTRQFVPATLIQSPLRGAVPVGNRGALKEQLNTLDEVSGYA